MNDLHKEVKFETEICEHLASHGWLYAEGYDRTRALFPADVLAWIQNTQPKAWDALEKNHTEQAGEMLFGRLRDSVNQRGTLDVLRHGVELLGLRQPLALAQFNPALAMNPEILAKYAANRLRVVRQVRYSLHNENCIDLVLFLNGIPVATCELKTDFTQSVEDAVDQYRFDREPRPKGQGSAEPLLSFPNGALVHFAVSNTEVRMTTRLEGPGTAFLPFNRGDHGAAGNPPSSTKRDNIAWSDVIPIGGHRTAYLWEEVCTKSYSIPCWWFPTAPYWIRNCRKRFSISNAPPGLWRRSRAKAPARSEALKGIMRWVKLHPYNIAAKGAGGGRAFSRECTK